MTLPPHVYEVKDRHGKIRFRFRKSRLPQRYLPHPASPDFASEYNACFLQPAENRKKPDQKPKLGRRSFSAYRGREVVYFISSGRGLVKIGTTINLSARLKKLQTGSGPILRVMVCIDGGSEVEAQYHKRFAESRFRGEWFYMTDAIKAEIKKLRRLSGCPTIEVHPRKVGQINRKNEWKSDV